MGRKKQTPRSPDEINITFKPNGDWFAIYVYQDAVHTGKGAWRKNESEARIAEAREIFSKDYFSSGSFKVPQNHYMDSPAKFSTRMRKDMKTLSVDSGTDCRSSLRDSIYPAIYSDYLVSKKFSKS